MFNIDLFEEKLKLDMNMDKKYFTIQMNDPETDELDFKIKVKFFGLQDKENYESDEPQRLRMKFIKKQGDLQKWYDVLQEMKDNVLDDILMTPETNEK